PHGCISSLLSLSLLSSVIHKIYQESTFLPPRTTQSHNANEYICHPQASRPLSILIAVFFPPFHSSDQEVLYIIAGSSCASKTPRPERDRRDDGRAARDRDMRRRRRPDDATRLCLRRPGRSATTDYSRGLVARDSPGRRRRPVLAVVDLPRRRRRRLSAAEVRPHHRRDRGRAGGVEGGGRSTPATAPGGGVSPPPSPPRAAGGTDEGGACQRGGRRRAGRPAAVQGQADDDGGRSGYCGRVRRRRVGDRRRRRRRCISDGCGRRRARSCSVVVDVGVDDRGQPRTSLPGLPRDWGPGSRDGVRAPNGGSSSRRRRRIRRRRPEWGGVRYRRRRLHRRRRCLSSSPHAPQPRRRRRRRRGQKPSRPLALLALLAFGALGALGALGDLGRLGWRRPPPRAVESRGDCARPGGGGGGGGGGGRRDREGDGRGWGEVGSARTASSSSYHQLCVVL
ncbi:hypothetical protein ACHAW5_001835, partial [Stephanodiscus triporus]